MYSTLHFSKHFLNHVFLFCLATLFAVCVGTVDGWTSPALPLLQNPKLPQGYNSSNNTFHHIITDDEASWIGSLAPLGALIGAIPAGYLANVLGRKQLLLLLTVPVLLGWMTIIFVQDSVCRLFYIVVHLSGVSDLWHYANLRYS
jgi:SP family facilitated glucose transporter-like MFS transporter 8